MATISQINANRRNALKSTGPKSPAGKARASQNALRHGFASKQIVLNTEDEAAFQALHAEFLAEYQPSGPTECLLVDEVAVAAWRLRRMQSLETVLLDVRFVLEKGFWDPETRNKFDQRDPSWTKFRQVEAFREGDALEKLSRYESRARRSFYKALAELRRHKARCPHPSAAAPTVRAVGIPSVSSPRSGLEPTASAVGLPTPFATPDGPHPQHSQSISAHVLREEAARRSAVPGTEAKPTKATGRTQSLPAKSTTSRPIGFVLPKGFNFLQLSGKQPEDWSLATTRGADFQSAARFSAPLELGH